MNRSISRIFMAGLVLAILATAPARADRFSIVVGGRDFDEDDWPGISAHPTVGFSAEFGPDYWSWRMVTGMSYSYEEGDLDQFFGVNTKFELQTLEVSFGTRRTWDGLFRRARPYFGGGLSAIGARTDVQIFSQTADDNDTSLGVYLEGGVFWEIGESFFLGFDGRLLAGTDIEVDRTVKTIGLSGVNPDSVDFWQVGARFGWSY